LAKTTLQPTIKGACICGRQWKLWLNDVKHWTDQQTDALQTDDRVLWRAVSTIAKHGNLTMRVKGQGEVRVTGKTVSASWIKKRGRVRRLWHSKSRCVFLCVTLPHWRNSIQPFAVRTCEQPGGKGTHSACN
jgi:hypothetical protein